MAPVLSHGVSDGVSEKATGLLLAGCPAFPRTENMLEWQRTAFHFQPKKNWMNDPNGPMLYNGLYHLFYQYNPDSPAFGNIVWGHAVSPDLINWTHLDIALKRDCSDDCKGVWSGSATILDNNRIVMLYTGCNKREEQVQNQAEPKDYSDTYLREWVKYKRNPVLLRPPYIGPKDFRDPTTAWKVGHDKYWRVAVGSKVGNSGIAILYRTADFVKYEQVPRPLHQVDGTGMWECVDFFPVSTIKDHGLDTSATEDGMKHVLKASKDNEQNDYFAIGRYESKEEKWYPQDPKMDVGKGLRLDYGVFYAAKTFYDKQKQRRVIWGWVREKDSEEADKLKNWAGLQAIPRTVAFDIKTRENLLQWPVKEVEMLRMTQNALSLRNIDLRPNVVIPLPILHASQVDIMVEFEILKCPFVGGADLVDEDGISKRTSLGPFGLFVLAHENLSPLQQGMLSEHTAVYFRPKTCEPCYFGHDLNSSSKANDVIKGVQGGAVAVLGGETYSVRTLVDHSIVESFAQGGRTCVTSRVYPTEAFQNPKVLLFNYAKGAIVRAKSINIWPMKSAIK